MSVDIETRRLRRGQVLHLAYKQFPALLMERLVEQQLYEQYRHNIGGMERDLAYLAQLGLIARHEEAALGVAFRGLRITPKGINVIEKTVVEPGVMV